jgi:hypothetical protein
VLNGDRPAREGIAEFRAVDLEQVRGVRSRHRAGIPGFSPYFTILSTT